MSQCTRTALHTALRRPSPCAVVVGFSGALLKPEVLGEEIKSRPPVLLVHGDADLAVPFGALALAEEALQLNGVPVTAYSRPGLGHGIDQAGLQLCAKPLARHLLPAPLTTAPTRQHPWRPPPPPPPTHRQARPT